MSRDCKSTKKYLNSTRNNAVFSSEWLIIRKFCIHLHRKKKRMKEKLRLLGPAILVVGLVATAYFLLTYESDVLWKAQELNLFLDTPLFLRQQMVSSGWLISWLGAYFTEFFYHEALGVGMLCAWWAVLMLVIGRTFRIPMKWSVVLLIPVAALLLTIVDLGYWLYYLKLKGHFFAATIGVGSDKPLNIKLYSRFGFSRKIKDCHYDPCGMDENNQPEYEETAWWLLSKDL